MDQADIADQFISEYLEKAVAAARGIVQPNPSPTSTHCIECGEQIPEQRRAIIMGCKRCVSCEEDHERRTVSTGARSKQSEYNDDLIEDILYVSKVCN